MLYALVRTAVGYALRVFYRVERAGADFPEVGPLLLVGNHPNALVDPALLLSVCPRPLTFLAKAPLFRLPFLGSLLRGLGALPVQRRQDGAANANANTLVLETGARALAAGHALAIFPEGRSHSESRMSELKTGAARMALSARAAVQVVPVGLTYADKGRFRSTVRVEVGPSLGVAQGEPPSADDVRALTARIGDALRGVTLQLDAWEDLPLVATAEALYALRTEGPQENAERRRLFARGMTLLRDEQPERYAALRQETGALVQRLALLHAGPGSLAVKYRPAMVFRFVFRNLLGLVLGLPFALVGGFLFLPWTLLVRAGIGVAHTEEDMEATVKLLSAIVLGPLYVLGMAAVVGTWLGWGWALALLVTSVPLALFSRTFFARRVEALRDVRLFLQLGNSSAIKQRLADESEALAGRIEAVVEEFAPRVSTPDVSSA